MNTPNIAQLKTPSFYIHQKPPAPQNCVYQHPTEHWVVRAYSDPNDKSEAVYQLWFWEDGLWRDTQHGNFGSKQLAIDFAINL